VPISKSSVTGHVKKGKLKLLKVVESIREGSYIWQTDTKIPAIMQSSLGWKAVDDGVFEVERPRQADLPAYGRAIEEFGFKVKRTEKQEIGAPVALDDEEKSLGQQTLDAYLGAKATAKTAAEASDDARDELKVWLVKNGAPKDPAHPDARLAQIGSHKVHNSWVKGRQTPWDDRDHGPVGDWAIQEGCADELLGVIVHKTIPFSEYEKDGIPEGFEGSVTIDPDVYEYYTRIGAVPPELHDTFEARGKGYYGVKVYETLELSCESCGATVKKTQKFCGECGTKRNV
jgi:hypothetical protein